MVKEMDGNSLDLQKENINKLKRLFPEIVTDNNKIDFDKLKDVMSSEIDEDDERYNFTWHGKRNAIKSVNIPSKGTLIPAKKKSKDWDTTQNVYIEGDNLEVLKLLQKSYANKIQVIYIDPPYNTGNDFVYEDNFKDDLEEYLVKTNQKEQGYKISTNTDTDGRYHTNWLNMMFPRLTLARKLLNENGAIFISIDDHEVANLIKICDEIFGEKNRVSLICHKSRGSVSNDKIISQNHNIILFYAKNIEKLEEIRKYIGINPDLNSFNLDDNDGRGKYKLTPTDGPGGAKKGNPYYEFMGVNKYWRFSLETITQKYKDGLIIKKNKDVYQKLFLKDTEKNRKTVTTWWDDAGLTSKATTDLKKLMGEETFDKPKPVKLIKRIIELMTYKEPDSIVLDFFSGSGTTAQSVMESNVDNKALKYILVQLPEAIDMKNDAFKNGYKMIPEIAEERIRRVGNQIKNNYPDAGIDIGFKVFELSNSNIKKWNTVPQRKNGQLNLIEQMNSITSNFIDGRTSEDIVYELLLKQGIELTDPIDMIQCDGSEVYSVNSGALYIVLGNEIKQDIVDKIVNNESIFEHDLSTIIIQDTGFNNDSDKLNIFEELRSSGFKDENLFTV